MPPLYVLIHLLAGLLCFHVVLRVRERAALVAALGVGALAVVGLGFLVERREDWAWLLMPLPDAGQVFLTNVSLEGAAVLSGILWVSASGRRERRRALAFALPLFGAALWSYAWYFGPTPPDVRGRADASGFCAQSSEESCSAAAAVTLLHRSGVAATEAEMAALCLTRAGKGTTPLGLFRGLAVKAGGHGLRPRRAHFARPEDLRSLRQAALINVGLRADTPPSVAAKMLEYGWSVGAWHSVVVLRADGAGKWLEVADPTNGKERWPADDLQHLWDGNALILVER